MKDPWSSSPGVIDTLRALFDLTTETLKINHGASDDDKAIDSEFSSLAAVLLRSLKERVDSLEL